MLGTRFIGYLNEYRRLNKLSEHELEKLHQDKLHTILEHTRKTIPFYRDYFKNIEPSNKPSLEEFPVFDKLSVRKNLEALVDPSSGNLKEYYSSGSSGIQGKVYLSSREESLVRAILINWWEWGGYEMGDHILQTGITPNRGVLKSVKDLLFKTDYHAAFGLSEDDVLKGLRKFVPTRKDFFGGFASSLFVFSEVAARNGISLSFESVFSWGDKMFPHYRKSIEKTFSTKVYDAYACNEGLMIAAQADLDYYYIMSPHIHLEILDDEGKHVPDGELGNVVVTSLDHFSMPLIRYKNGDLAVKLPREKYPEHRKMKYPLLERVVGRDTDIIKTKQGKILIVHFFTGIFEFYPQVRQFRVIQNDLEGILIEVIPDKGFDTTVLENIRKEILEKMEGNMKIEFVEVENIPATSSGKPQIIQNNLIRKESSF